MSHLISNLLEPAPLNRYRSDLQEAHDRLVNAARTWDPMAPPLASWGQSAKRQLVPVASLHPMVAATDQAFNEVMNQLATVERLLDAIAWAGSEGATRIDECNPTTSNWHPHDLVLSDSGRPWGVFEVSDVAGPGGNENDKMKKDLKRLVDCECGPCGTGARRFLAVSESSGKWLEGMAASPRRMAGFTHAVSVIEVYSSTWIAEVVHGNVVMSG